MVVDAMDQTQSRSIGKGYGFYFPIALGLVGLLSVVYLLMVILYWDLWNAFWSTEAWWIVVLPVLATGFYLFIFVCILKGDDDRRTLMRGNALSQLCREINSKYLSKSDVNVACGNFSAWLEINYDPNQSKFKLY